MRLKKKVKDLLERVQDLEQNFKVLKLDLDLYTTRLKASKGITKKIPDQETKDLKSDMLLPE